MRKRILICAMRKPRAHRMRWFRGRRTALAGLVVADLMLVCLASGYGYHVAAYYIVMCLAPLAILAMPRYIEPQRRQALRPPEG